MFYAFREGFLRLRANLGLVFVVFTTNLGLAALLALPLAAQLEADLGNRGAAATNLYGFDSSWHGAWRAEQKGFAREFGPEIFGAGFALRNLELLLEGRLPGRLFAWTKDGPGAEVDPIVLSLALVYLVVQTFLAGGLISAFRAERGEWRLRAFLHGCGFYFGRLFRVSLLALLAAYVVFRLNAPFARLVDHLARESVSETSALALSVGRHLLLLLALLLVGLLSGYAKAIVVVEERASALLAWVSAAGFCGRHAGAAVGHFAAVFALGLLALASWSFLDGLFVTTGYKTQLVAFALMQAFVLTRIGLRLALLAGQTALVRRVA